VPRPGRGRHQGSAAIIASGSNLLRHTMILVPDTVAIAGISTRPYSLESWLFPSVRHSVPKALSKSDTRRFKEAAALLLL
jgi:hypothetical protein